MFGRIGKRDNLRFRMNASDPVQILAPPDNSYRCEGVAFSSSGNVIAVADSDNVLLFRRKADGPFEDMPYLSLRGPESQSNHQHDVSFSPWRDTELLAVVQRRGALIIYEKNRANDDYGPEPVCVVCGPETKLNSSGGVAFVPPDNTHIAASNGGGGVTFYRGVSSDRIDFKLEPVFELKHPSLDNPDGLAFSPCGRWLALTNHGNHTVSIFCRRNMISSRGKLEYGPEPVTILKDPQLRHPHSVAFTPGTNHLVVTNAAANYFSAYEPKRHGFGLRWSQSPVLRRSFGPNHMFFEVNKHNKMEGGPKGIAIHKNCLAVSSPEIGIKIYSFDERR